MDMVAFSFLPYFRTGSTFFYTFYQAVINTEEWVLEHIPAGRSGEANFIDFYNAKVRGW